jgi:Zn-dependent protease
MIIAPPAIFSITCHEVAHGWVASRFGDETARSRGRLTLNPLPHIDPVGTIIVPVMLAMIHAPIIGWAKPVPVNFRNLESPKKHMGYVAAAGPITNLLLAVCCALGINFMFWIFPGPGASGTGAIYSFLSPLKWMLFVGIQINVMLAIFNLLPIPPMDGSKVAISVLPMPYAGWFIRMERYGILPLLVLFMIPATNRMIIGLTDPIVNLVLRSLIHGAMGGFLGPPS